MCVIVCTDSHDASSYIELCTKSLMAYMYHYIVVFTLMSVVSWLIT